MPIKNIDIKASLMTHVSKMKENEDIAYLRFAAGYFKSRYGMSIKSIYSLFFEQGVNITLKERAIDRDENITAYHYTKKFADEKCCFISDIMTEMLVKGLKDFHFYKENKEEIDRIYKKQKSL